MQRVGWKHFLRWEDEKPVLEALYLDRGVAIDQLAREPETLRNITDAFNAICSRNDPAPDLVRYMLNRRKNSDWPKLGARAKKFESVLRLFSPYQLTALESIYLDLDIPSDDFLFRPGMMQEIAIRFERLTKTKVSASDLVAVIVAKRKRGDWVRIREEFADIDQAADL